MNSTVMVEKKGMRGRKKAKEQWLIMGSLTEESEGRLVFMNTGELVWSH